MLLTRSLALALALLVAAPVVLAPAPVSAQKAAVSKDVSFSKEELDQILAPIALYPDDLVSNVLVASTYPLEVVQAARWIAEPANAKLKGDALTKALEAKDWDPSVKSLTQFPDVLAMMSERLDWTQKLGDAFVASEADVMDRIQFLRDKAEEAGNLKSNEHQTVTTKSVGGDEYIYIEPADPEIVYVPVYEPAVYGSWWYPNYPPYYWPADGVYEDDYYWGSGVSVFLPLWGWARPHWHDHYIHVDVRRYNRFSRHRKIISSRWRASAHHRRGVEFRSDGARRGHVEQELRNIRRRHGHAGHAAAPDHRHRAASAGPQRHSAGGKRGRHNHVSSKPRRRSSAHRHSRGHSRARAHHSRRRTHHGGHRAHRGGHRAHHGGHRAHRGGHRAHHGGHRAGARHGGGHHRGGHHGGHHGGGHRGGRYR